MAFDTTETIAAPGLVWPYIDPRVDTGVLQDDKDSEGGFALFALKGQPGKVWATKPASAGIFVGIAIRKNTCDSYKAGDVINILRKGRIWVKALGECLSEETAYVNNSNGGITASSSSATQIPGGVFKSNAADGKLVQLEIA